MPTTFIFDEHHQNINRMILPNHVRKYFDHGASTTLKKIRLDPKLASGAVNYSDATVQSGSSNQHEQNASIASKLSNRIKYRTSRNVPHALPNKVEPKALPAVNEASKDNLNPESDVETTTPSIESLLPSKIIPSLPPHLRGLTTTTPLPAIFFNNSFISNLTAQLGQSVFLPCRTQHSSDRKVINE